MLRTNLWPLLLLLRALRLGIIVLSLLVLVCVFAPLLLLLLLLATLAPRISPPLPARPTPLVRAITAPFRLVLSISSSMGAMLACRSEDRERRMRGTQ